MKSKAAVLAVTLLATAAQATESSSQATSKRPAPSQQVIATNAFSSMVIGDGGALWGMGGDVHSQGLWSQNEMVPSTPVRVPGTRGVVSLAMGTSHSLALMEDGTVQAWGQNYCAIGAGVSPLHLTPTRVPMPCRLTAVGRREGQPTDCAALP